MESKLELLEAILEALDGSLSAGQVDLLTRAVQSHGDALQRLSDSDDAFVCGLLARLLLKGGSDAVLHP